MDDARVRETVEAWLTGAVIGLNLCPFAAPVVRQKQWRLRVLREADGQETLGPIVDEILALLTEGATHRTTLVATPACFADFEDFLDAVAAVDDVIDRMGLRGHVQLAHFHPRYLFADVPPDDISHWTNRAPYPIFHLLREDDVAEALARYPDAEGIPDRNIARLRSLGWAEVRRIVGLAP